jgi:hypothetical protein
MSLRNGVVEIAMIPHNFGYVTVIVSQQLFIVGLVWYVMHLLDQARRQRHRHYSTMTLTNASASCDLAVLAARLSKLGDVQTDPIPLPAKVRIRQEERV